MGGSLFVFVCIYMCAYTGMCVCICVYIFVLRYFYVDSCYESGVLFGDALDSSLANEKARTIYLVSLYNTISIST